MKAQIGVANGRLCHAEHSTSRNTPAESRFLRNSIEKACGLLRSRNRQITFGLVSEELRSLRPRLNATALFTGATFAALSGAAAFAADSPPPIFEQINQGDVGEVTVAAGDKDSRPASAKQGKNIKTGEAKVALASNTSETAEEKEVMEPPQKLDKDMIEQLRSDLTNFFYNKYEVNGYAIETITGDEWKVVVAYVDGEWYATTNIKSYEGVYHDRRAVFTIDPQGFVDTGKNDDGYYDIINIWNDLTESLGKATGQTGRALYLTQKNGLEPGIDVKLVETDGPIVYAHVKVTEQWGYTIELNLKKGRDKRIAELDSKDLAKIFGNGEKQAKAGSDDASQIASKSEKSGK